LLPIWGKLVGQQRPSMSSLARASQQTVPLAEQYASLPQ
jgi:hypothetical protein